MSINQYAGLCDLLILFYESNHIPKLDQNNRWDEPGFPRSNPKLWYFWAYFQLSFFFVLRILSVVQLPYPGTENRVFGSGTKMKPIFIGWGNY
jgi:hypothetical protein